MNARWDEGGGSRPTSSFDFDNDETMVMRALPQNIDPPHMSRAEARKQREARNKRAKRGKKVGVLALLVLVIAVLGVGCRPTTKCSCSPAWSKRERRARVLPNPSESARHIPAGSSPLPH